MQKKTRQFANDRHDNQRNSERTNSPSPRKRFDTALVVAGFLVALVLGVLTWFNYQEYQTAAEGRFAGSRETPKQK